MVPLEYSEQQSVNHTTRYYRVCACASYPNTQGRGELWAAAGSELIRISSSFPVTFVDFQSLTGFYVAKGTEIMGLGV